ncbi:MAG: CDP-glucose 4,6-dehydratase [Desulfobaccales bacterium]
MEETILNQSFWQGRRVFITGHTGFKGAWLCLLLHYLQAEVTGYALPPPTEPSLFEAARVTDLVHSIRGDVRDLDTFAAAMHQAAPEIVVHMAAQSLVRESYVTPVETYATNMMGTVHLLEAVRRTPGIRAVINVTSDKCYENKEWVWGYREDDPLGGFDPYASSKACAEVITAAYRRSFFPLADYPRHGVAVATARAGNVIGGGDWAKDRLIPDCVRSLLVNRTIILRSPKAVRPWQFVLEPLCGYLLLAERLFEEGPPYGEAWNFGPEEGEAKTVAWVVQSLCSLWGEDASFEIVGGDHPHESHYLKIDAAKARWRLGWRPRWRLARTLENIVAWTRAYGDRHDMRKVCLHQIAQYLNQQAK